jgi:hypothetical protein
MFKTIRLMANLVIVGFVVGRAYNEWQHRSRTVTVRHPRPRHPLPRW